ncbi:MAG: hypothetical protein JW751_18470 [Polyangiaceae bacterium]|nr:hypothetical protein [Polyangiaceae bacterium]
MGVLSCWDRIIVHGTLPGFGHSAGMTSYLTAHGVRIFDYTKFAEPLRDQIRRNAERLATENGIEIEFLRQRKARKEAAAPPLIIARSVLPIVRQFARATKVRHVGGSEPGVAAKRGWAIAVSAWVARCPVSTASRSPPHALSRHEPGSM